MLPKVLTALALGLTSVTGLISAHPGKTHSLPRAELGRRQLEANKRHLKARNCASQIAQFNAKRKAKRALAERNKETTSLDGLHFRRQGQSTATENGPTYSTIQNSTCVSAPEVTEGPYYINNEYLRQDISEGQGGVPLILDIGVMDVTTCQSLDQALVEIWHCNATGQYSGFTDVHPNAPKSENHATVDKNTAPPNGLRSVRMTDQLTFLRGGWATNSEGMVEFKSIYPGYYTGRAVHIHTMVQTDYSVATNGSIISHAGSLHHVGQLFFEETLNDKIVTQGVYASTTQSRTYNTEDKIMDSENTDGYNAIASTELLGENETDGILAYITIGVDPTFVGSIKSTNYMTLHMEESSN